MLGSKSRWMSLFPIVLNRYFTMLHFLGDHSSARVSVLHKLSYAMKVEICCGTETP